ncbi:MAG: TM2 domain-containing protein [Alphaproteobacteria bacterium]|nr:MAG: TM2 domain-containing protein [Alphaproteobacteria bacterium]
MAYEAQRKSGLLAYALWFFLGTFGVHRFYLGHWTSGFIMLGLTALGSLTWVIVIGWLFLGVVGLWWLLDAILTYRMVEDYNIGLAASLS